ncbi:hypothetical protein [Thermus thermophilus]|uniref:hypothetical protein n=1 Tax=Thermus thermophilus TaxID=274 RepID=UPI002094DF72|nr:hypothetical protein [Thermus thermophilus]
MEEEAHKPRPLVLGLEQGELPLLEGQELPEGPKEEAEGLLGLLGRGSRALPVEGKLPLLQKLFPLKGTLGEHPSPEDHPHRVAPQELREEGEVFGEALDHG